MIKVYICIIKKEKEQIMHRGETKLSFYNYYSKPFYFVKERRQFVSFLYVLLLCLFSSCSTTKFVPQGQALLDKVDIKVKNPDIKKDELYKFLRQSPNSSVFGVWRMQLNTYSLAGRDTTSWLNRVLMRAGEAPVIYSETQRYLSEQYLTKVLHNRGYMNATVSSDVEIKNKKARVQFFITEREPYRLRNYEVEFQNEDLQAAAADSSASLLRSNILFNVDVLDQERERIAKTLRNIGYYKFNKDFLIYKVDSAFNEHVVDVKLILRELDDEDEMNTVYKKIFTKFYMREVFYSADSNAKYRQISNDELKDSELIRAGYFALKKGDQNFLRLKTLIGNTFIRPMENYSDLNVEKTYAALNNLPPVKYLNINLNEIEGTDSLDCSISLVPGDALSLTTELEATYTEGFWGVAVNAGTIHRNVFKGAESLSLQGRFASEWQKGVLAREWGAQVGLLFPNFLFPFVSSDFRYKIRANTNFTTNLNYQFRPEEFVLRNLGLGIKYGWQMKRFRHTLELIDLNFVDFDVTDVFKRTFLETNKFNRHNYEDLLISRIGYIGAFSTYNVARPLKNHFSMRYSFETSGNMFSLINAVFGGKQNKDDFYTIMGVPYSQYVRGTYNFSYHQIFDDENRFVYHFGLGVGIPYGNSGVIPYQRRFFAGGANSVRGWSETTLGPGVYQKNKNIRGRDYNQMGDVKLDINFEYRYKMFNHFDGALFFDAGNVWTVKSYSMQAGGEFKFNEFYKQIGLAYGLGVRLDLSFVLIRLDWGIKLFDPARENGWIKSPGRHHHAIHFGIGYPF